MLAAIDLGTEIPTMLTNSGAGIAVEPDNSEQFTGALRNALSDPQALIRMGNAGRTWVETHASPAAVAAQYEAIFLANR
jgi:glycosyltransferase involved in cell wall biosynthesis